MKKRWPCRWTGWFGKVTSSSMSGDGPSIALAGSSLNPSQFTIAVIRAVGNAFLIAAMAGSIKTLSPRVPTV